MFRFLDKALIIEMHNDEIRSYGGSMGFLNESLLDSALAQPALALQFSEPSIYDLAAIYGYHICKNHAFNDGNKRTAVVAMMVFLDINGYDINASENDIIETILAVASNKIDKQQLASWLESVAVKR